MLTAARRARLHASLLAWFRANRRALPWRATRDPYAIWLSEVMLQQTTVRTVEPRWHRFLARFPTLVALAAAPLEDVLNEWSGLGYYARARNLHRCAVCVARDHGGEFPRTAAALRELPGMGPYTAAAVASIAFGEAVALVDANVERVLARWLAIGGDPKSPGTRRALWAAAEDALAHDSPGEWNEAMMELGALVCLPRGPRCADCPVRPDCDAAKRGTPEAFPEISPRAPMEERHEVAVIVHRGSRLLVLERPPRGTFAGMWELPRDVRQEGEPDTDAARRVLRSVAGLDTSSTPAPVAVIRHTVMRSRIVLHVLRATVPTRARPAAPSHSAFEWIEPSEWLARPISTTQRDIAVWLATGATPRRLRLVDGKLELRIS